MPPSAALIHQLTHHPGELTASAVVCGDPYAAVATWEAARVTCPGCRRPPCTCGPGTTPCPACRAWNRTQRARQTTPPGPLRTEKAFQEWLRQQAQAAGFLYYHPTDSRASPAGFPDTVCVRDTRLVVAELKMPGKDPTPAQQRWLTALRQVTTVETCLWYPDDMTQILAVLR